MLRQPLKNSSALLMSLTVASGISIGLTGCVDNDYDLSKDIDMTVTIGGQEIHLPVSSTDVLTMQQILDIDPETSSIKIAKEGEYGLHAGDYVLVQSGSESKSKIEINRVKLDNLSGDRTSTDLQFNLIPTLDEVVVPTGNIVSNLNIEDSNITTDLKSISSAQTDLTMKLDISYSSNTYNGMARLKKGLTAIFDSKWTIALADAASSQIAEVINGHILRLTRDVDFNRSGFSILVKVISISGLTDVKGNGLYEPGKFKLDSRIEFNGDMAVINSAHESGVEEVSLITNTNLTNAELLSVTGRVDPAINVDPTVVTINDIPDFLAEQGNNLDIADPMFHILVSNSSPVAADINATLIAYSKNGTETVNIGKKYGTDPIQIGASCTSDIVISRTGSNGSIRVPDLGNLLTTVPDRIEITNVDVNADQSREVTFQLGTEYDFRSNYEAIIPFAFGKNLRLNYTKEESDWDDDLKDYNFNEVHISSNVVNTSPLTLAPSAIALDADGNELPDVTAEVTGNVAGGSMSAPTTSPIKIILRSTGKNLSRLKGVKYSFEGTMDDQHVNQNLNVSQSIRFDQIEVSIIGGITIDLND